MHANLLRDLTETKSEISAQFQILNHRISALENTPNTQNELARLNAILMQYSADMVGLKKYCGTKSDHKCHEICRTNAPVDGLVTKS